MPKVWNIGNTTVRNPKRIENALKVFYNEGFSGNARGSEIEAKLHECFRDNKILEFDGKPSDWNGRKWRAAFYQLGFITYTKYKVCNEVLTIKELFSKFGIEEIHLPYQITPAGKKLISTNSIPQINDIYIRQFTCYEIPNSLEKNFSEGKMKPFILFLQVLLLLDKEEMEGLNKFETGLFIQKFRNHTNKLPEEIINEITLYREKINRCKNSKEKRKINKIYLEDLDYFAGINPRSVVNDYSDTTFRYFNLSGLFTRIKDRIIIRKNRIEYVKELLNNEPDFLFDKNPINYLNKYYTNTYSIPTDDKSYALFEIDYLKRNIKNDESTLLKKANEISYETDIQSINMVREELVQYETLEKEVNYAVEQQDKEQIENIIKYLKVLNGEGKFSDFEIDDKPAYLEWAVWRAFLAINEIICPINKTRRFPLDYDLLPRNTAPGGGSDAIFEFETYVLVIEVTLTTSSRQVAVESEPVKRHTVKYKKQYSNKDVYCLFIAPSVDNNVIDTFRLGVWYNQDEEIFINIVPMNLKDFICTIETLQHKKFNNQNFRLLLDRCLALRNNRAPQWKELIEKEIKQWKTRLISN